MTSTLIKICVIAAIIQPIQSVAEDWSSIIQKKEYEVFVDLDSYNQEENLPYITTKTVYKKPQLSSKSLSSKAYVKHILQLQFNCNRPIYRMRFSTYLNAQDKLVALDTAEKKFQPIETGGDVFSIGQLTCQVHQMLGGA